MYPRSRSIPFNFHLPSITLFSWSLCAPPSLTSVCSIYIGLASLGPFIYFLSRTNLTRYPPGTIITPSSFRREMTLHSFTLHFIAGFDFPCVWKFFPWLFLPIWSHKACTRALRCLFTLLNFLDLTYCSACILACALRRTS
jgi:hypothetical protein